MSDLKYIKSEITQSDKNALAFYKILGQIINKLKEQMGCEKYKLVYLKISPQTLVNYEKWWDSYISLKE